MFAQMEICRKLKTHSRHRLDFKTEHLRYVSVCVNSLNYSGYIGVIMYMYNSITTVDVRVFMCDVLVCATNLSLGCIRLISLVKNVY